MAVRVGTGASSASPPVEAEAAKAVQSAISVVVNRMAMWWGYREREE